MITDVTVVAPVYRNAATLPELLRRLNAALPCRWRLHLVIDACPGGSLAAARRLAEADPRLTVLELPQNEGQHRAIAHGLAVDAESRFWVCLDADLQDPPEAIPSLLSRLDREDVAGVFAGRRGSYESRGRRWSGTAHRSVLAALTGMPADAGAFFAMDLTLRNIVRRTVLEAGAPSVVAAAALSGLPLGSIPVRRDVRAEGTSTWTSRARATQSARTLLWAARHRTA